MKVKKKKELTKITNRQKSKHDGSHTYNKSKISY